MLIDSFAADFSPVHVHIGKFLPAPTADETAAGGTSHGLELSAKN
jgi:hypothetical protein